MLFSQIVVIFLVALAVNADAVDEKLSVFKLQNHANFEIFGNFKFELDGKIHIDSFTLGKRQAFKKSWPKESTNITVVALDAELTYFSAGKKTFGGLIYEITQLDPAADECAVAWGLKQQSMVTKVDCSTIQGPYIN